MDTEKARRRLLLKQRELLENIRRLEEEGRNSRDAEVEDPIDQVTSAEGKAVAFQEASIEHETLAQVRLALQRLDEGTYGKCVECGRAIEEARLEAIPWAPYCRQHQEERERPGAATLPFA